MSDSAIRRAREQLVPVDEFTEFIEDAPMCEYCGSYEVLVVELSSGRGTLYVDHTQCEECGHRTRSPNRKRAAENIRLGQIGLGAHKQAWHEGEYKKFMEWRERNANT